MINWTAYKPCYMAEKGESGAVYNSTCNSDCLSGGRSERNFPAKLNCRYWTLNLSCTDESWSRQEGWDRKRVGHTGKKINAWNFQFWIVLQKRPHRRSWENYIKLNIRVADGDNVKSVFLPRRKVQWWADKLVAVNIEFHSNREYSLLSAKLEKCSYELIS